MGIYKTLNPEDVSLRSFQVHKEFTFTHNDSGSGVYGLRAISGSNYNFNIGSSSTISQSFGEYSAVSASLGKEPYLATFYSVPLWNMIFKKFYFDIDIADSDYVNTEHWFKSSSPSGSQAIVDKNFQTHTTSQFSSRQLNGNASVITIPRKFFGEEIKPKSITITDNSTDETKTLVDDGLGNIYDNAYSSSYAIASESFGPAGSSITGSVIGNVMYGQGLIIITETGSYNRVGSTSGSDGWSVSFKSTQTIYEREVFCNVERGEFLRSNNPTITPGNSGSFFIPDGLFSGSYSTGHRLLNPLFPASSSFKTVETTDLVSGESYRTNAIYHGTSLIKDFATGSDFAPYITTIGLYDDTDDLLAVGRLAKPVKNDKELDISFVVRFDV
jgi:hypothetical protein